MVANRSPRKTSTSPLFLRFLHLKGSEHPLVRILHNLELRAIICWRKIANAETGGLLKGATDENGQLKSAGLMVGIKLDLEAEVHLTARIRGDVVIGLY